MVASQAIYRSSILRTRTNIGWRVSVHCGKINRFLWSPIIYRILILTNMKEVTIYTTPTCGYCKMAKEFFTANNVEYKEYNVGTDLEKRKEMIEKSGQMGVPVIIVGDDMTVGFDKSRLSSLLGIA